MTDNAKANKIKAALLIGTMLHAACFGIYVLIVAWVSGGTIETGGVRALAAFLGIAWLWAQAGILELGGLRKQLTNQLFEAAVSDEK
jgi:uncharacterized membrane protein YqjE